MPPKKTDATAPDNNAPVSAPEAPEGRDVYLDLLMLIARHVTGKLTAQTPEEILEGE